MKIRLGSSLVLSAFALSSLAHAADADKDKDVRAECVSAFETSQELRASGDLVTARSRLVSCVRPECPSSVRTECAKWLEQVEREQPSFVAAAKADGEDRLDVKVEMDGKLVQETLDGKASPVNPGAHQFRFYLPPFQPIEKRVVLSEGDKLRAISVEFTSPKPAAAAVLPAPTPAPVRTHRPVPAPVYVLGGVAVLGSSKQSDLEKSCAPSCAHDDVKEVRRNYLFADVSMGVGAAALLTGAILYFTRPERPIEDSAQVSVAPTNGGMSASARFRF
jgi:hypothetical protein